VGVGVLLRDDTTSAQGGGAVIKTAIDNGDVNGDGKTDITDAVYLLDSLFLGGPAPVPFRNVLPDTGQTTCFNEFGGFNTCDDEDFYPRQDGKYPTGCQGEGRFTVNDHGTPENPNDDTVIDGCTGLEWQRRTSNLIVDWKSALFESAQFGEGWRLPNVAELQSLVDYGSAFAINPVFIDPMAPTWYWSSTSIPSSAGLAAVVLFGAFIDGSDSGTSYGVKTEIKYAVRAVRGP
jgi:hypothetical protein